MRYGFFPGCTPRAAAGYKESVEAINLRLGIELVEIEDWNCCGATTAFSLYQDDGLYLVARIMALANQQQLNEIVTVCNACYTTLNKASEYLQSDSVAHNKINERLKTEGLVLAEILPIRHYLELLVNDVPEENWQFESDKPAFEEKVAVYYGCQLTRPWQKVDHPESPNILDNFFEKLGFEVVDYSAKTLCCGAALAVPYAKNCKDLVARIIRSSQHAGADLIVTICPMCQFNLETLQRHTKLSSMPIPFFTQLIGLRMGIDPSELGINKLLIPLKLKQLATNDA